MPGAFIGVGSPPRAWGQSQRAAARLASCRFTPTGVGTMLYARRAVPVLSVHPHGRGDNRRAGGVWMQRFGSPPRAWGQWPAQYAARKPYRFTPTGVGTMKRGGPTYTARSVHPHGRGDNAISGFPRDFAGGSPPRAWGQLPGSGRSGTGTRFTPTGVGTMCGTCRSVSTGAVHPHGRGDNRLTVPTYAAILGSPPRAWGQSLDSPDLCCYSRFTPTGVGTIAGRCSGSASPPVHPHGRGDNGSITSQSITYGGSPPRAWGQSPRRLTWRCRRRFTPTGVGTIADCAQANPLHTVHPHGRGDNTIAKVNGSIIAGSPPRAWGQYGVALDAYTPVRFTPTGVGTI